MKIVYDNIIFSLQKAGGISIYWYELIKRLQEQDDIRYFESKNENIFRKELSLIIKRESFLPIKFLRYLPFVKKLPSKSIFHSSYYRISLQKDILNITTVHDFTYEYFKKGIVKYIHTLQKGYAIKNSDGIICVSENTKKDLLEFFPNINPLKIKVIYNGVSDDFSLLKETTLFNKFNNLLNKKYLLYVGDRSSYKNFSIAVDIVREMKDKYLVIIGGKAFTNNELRILKSVKNRFFHFQGINSKDLNLLYNNAFCLLYPSSYEGFGIPVIEAMKAGCPVIATNSSSIPEVAGNAGLLIDEVKVEKFIEKINYLEDEKFRNNIIKKGIHQAEKFSWDICFKKTYEFYEEICSKK